MAKPLIIANWKAEGSLADVGGYAATVQAASICMSAEIVICPPSPLLMPLQAAAGGVIAIGGQDCRSAFEGGASGTPAATLLAEVGCRYVLIGHADRRAAGDDDRILQSKLTETAKAGLIPVFCISEIEELTVLACVACARVVIAWEPLWAIGSGRTPELPEIAAQLALIGQRAAQIVSDTEVAMLYGGSVTPETAGGILALPGCGGVLVGKAANKPAGLVAIAKTLPTII